MKTTIYNQDNKEIGDIDLPGFIFGKKWRPDVVHQVLVAIQANRRKNIAHTKGTGEKRGGGKKPWRQKGTGRARHGTIRSPLWRGGGVTFGPTKERNFTKKVNKKVKRLALFSALSKKLLDKEIKVIDDIKLESPKTKAAHLILKNLIPEKKNSGLLILDKGNPEISRSVRNLTIAQTATVRNFNLEDILKYKNIIFTKDAIAELGNVYKEKK